MSNPFLEVDYRFNKSDWTVRRFYGHGEFSEIWRSSYVASIGPDEIGLLEYLLKNAAERGVVAYREDKTAFEVESVDGRVMIWCFYGCGLYVIPVSG